ncbi:GNAT family N-acetyltransferase [Sphingomonas xinjiangensis]|uniref:GNAT superfamily N-acetyltransferase n=1 Tax=Sphingomonas xinjiangensis TaxID=643568 RepID=A0A840YTS8_9SPHN|nr:GNAT family N-acetyltransferase [Sphingomonas xinjiangensis]MBB5713068.1 GNAT superfamily N-acetyltransferase [Sphingomonas xinjiangensis]
MVNMTKVRHAEPSDLSMLIPFDLFPGDRIVEIVERRMLVAEVSGSVVGYLAWQHRGCLEKDYINKLVVAESFRRQGLASTLLDVLCKRLRGRVFIATGARNIAANALLAGCGWAYAGEIVGILPDDEAQVFYRKDLG